jgi:hypothetical protein
MKKIIIIAGSILCVLAFMIFMAQTCEEGTVGYPSYVGTWQNIYMQSPGDDVKVVATFTESTWQMDIFTGGAPWSYLMGVKGSLTVSGDNFTMTLDGGRWPDSPYTSWYNMSDIETGDGYYFGPFYYILSYLIQSPYDFPYSYEDFNYYAAYNYAQSGNYPQMKGQWAISSSGNTMIMYYEIWGANYFNAYHPPWNPEFIPHDGMEFTKVQ